MKSLDYRMNEFELLVNDYLIVHSPLISRRQLYVQQVQMLFAQKCQIFPRH